MNWREITAGTKFRDESGSEYTLVDCPTGGPQFKANGQLVQLERPEAEQLTPVDEDGSRDKLDIPREVHEMTRVDPPIPVEEGRANVRALDLPLAFDEVSGIGPERSQPLEEIGLRDTFDLAIVAGIGLPPTAVKNSLNSLPDQQRRKLQDLAEEINDRAIMDAADDGKIPRRRDGPPGPFAFTISADLRNPQRKIDAEVSKRGGDSPDRVTTERKDGDILVTVYGCSEG